MKDIIEQLKAWADLSQWCATDAELRGKLLVGAAVNKIERLEAEVERLRAALAAIQDEANTFGDGYGDCGSVYVRQLDRVWGMAHDALSQEARRG